MTDRQSRALEAALSGLGVMVENTIVWNGLPAVVSKKTDLESLISKILLEQDKQTADTTGNAAGKSVKKKDAAMKAWAIAKPMAVFANDTNDYVLRNEIDFALSDLMSGKDVDVRDRWQLVHDRANTHIVALTAGGYGVVAADVTALQTLIDDFVAVESKPRVAKTQSAAATKELKKLFDMLREMKSELIELLTPFALSNVSFYSSVVDGFEIVDIGTRHIALRLTFIDEVTGIRLGNVKGLIQEVQVGKFSSSAGVMDFSFQELPDGNYTFIGALPLYEDVSIDNIGIEKGKLKRIDIKLKKKV